MKIEKIKAILEMAPKGATHYSHGTYLYKRTKGAMCWMWFNPADRTWVENQYIYRLDEFRNLEDLQMIDDWFGVTM